MSLRLAPELSHGIYDTIFSNKFQANDGKHDHNHDVMVKFGAGFRCKYAANAPCMCVYGRVRACTNNDKKQIVILQEVEYESGYI